MQIIQEKDVLHIINGVRKLFGDGVFITYKESSNSYVGLAVDRKGEIKPLFNNKQEEVIDKIDKELGKTVFYFSIRDFLYYYTPNRGQYY